VALWRDHLSSVCGIDRQPGGEQADGQETTNALDIGRRKVSRFFQICYQNNRTLLSSNNLLI
jgi:hypothetical protein